MIRSIRWLTIFGWLGLLTIAYRPVVAQAPAEAGLPAVEAAAVGMDAATLDQIADRLRAFVAQRQIAGAVTLVAKDGKVPHLAAVGWADVDAKAPMRPDSLFAIASMTKPIAASAVMILQDQGKLSLDDPVSKYLPVFQDATLQGGAKPKREITIRDVLTHTSGLGGDQRNEGTLRETAEALAKRPLAFEPGTRWQYSPGLNVAGRVVEVASGQPFDDFLEQHIFRPLRMKDTTFNPNAEQRKRVVKLYKPGPDKKSLEATSTWINDLSTKREPNPSGGLFSTAADLARFYQMVLNGGELDGKRILSKAAVAEMTRLQTGELMTGFTPGNGWGLGFCLIREPQGATKMLSAGSFGHGGAFGTQGWIDPQRQMIFVLLIQRTGFGNSDGSDIRGTFQELAVQALKK